MRMCYTIGPYRSKTVYGIKQNIDSAESLAVDLWKEGFSVICPHKNTAFLDGIIADEQILDGDFEMLQHCDFAVTARGWEKSPGSLMEIEFCKNRNIPVYYSLEEALKNQKVKP